MIIGALGVMLYFQQKRLRLLEEATKRASTAMGGWSEMNENHEKNEKVLGWLSAMLMMENASGRTSQCQPALPELPIRIPHQPAELPG
jgi:hypothetical protein